MKRILLFCALGALWGCRQATAPNGDAITLCYSTSEQSKTDALTAGEEVAVWARIDGTENYFLEGEKFITGSDGKTLTVTPAMYYPETKQAVEFFAYFPYHTGSFSVPTDQSTAAALKQADLCWATTKSTPIAVVPLTFQHLFARLIVQTNELTTKIACQVVPSGTLNPATGVFTLNSTKSEVSTTGVELILPPQTINRLVLAVSGVEYIYDGSINLQIGQTTTVNLTAHPSTKTATLNESTNTKWETTTSNGNPDPHTDNVLLIHCAPEYPQPNEILKIVLTINDMMSGATTDYTVDNGITLSDGAFSVPFTSTELSYPYTIVQIKAYKNNGVMAFCATPFVGAITYKSGIATCGLRLRNPINPPTPSDYIVVKGLKWAKGNLVAVDASTPGQINGCKVGAPTDGGLFFQFGSLIGWKGGALAYGGTGQGVPPLSWGGSRWWGGASSFSFANDAMVWPTAMDNNRPTVWPNNQSTNKWYFGLRTGWSTATQNISDYPGFTAGTFAADGVGDACTYYLGSPWRLPTMYEWVACIFNNAAAGGEAINYYPNLGGAWISSEPQAVAFVGGQLRFTVGNMRTPTGYFTYNQVAWSGSMSSVLDATSAYTPIGDAYYCHPARYLNRATGVTVRCVSN